MASPTPYIALVAGEASGDILGADLIRALKHHFPHVAFCGIGGPRMIAEGMQSFYPLERLSVMGLVEPLKRLPELLRIRADLKQRFSRNPPLVFIGIDSPDFVLNIAAHLKQRHIPAVHYVSPSVWAWRKGRIHKISRAIDLMLTLFPFEVDIYQQHNIPVVCVGHPLADQIPLEDGAGVARQSLQLAEQGRYLALMPGSRRGEVSLLLPLFLQTFELLRYQDDTLQALLPVAAPHLMPIVEEHLAQIDTQDRAAITVLNGQSQAAMAASQAVLLSSGTATLEAMLLRRPMVVAYKMGGVSYALLSRWVKTPYISLPNLLAQRELVPEFIQDAATPSAMAAALAPLLHHGEARQDTLETFSALHTMLRRDAGATAAHAIATLLEARHAAG
ncbi:MAG TPA: lipid-A-disaccharide synthase [Pseudomonadales bacterium]|nr:lipid-A-disaccharide synthase [Pseudomonadales bacterium]